MNYDENYTNALNTIIPAITLIIVLLAFLRQIDEFKKTFSLLEETRNLQVRDSINKAKPVLELNYDNYNLSTGSLSIIVFNAINRGGEMTSVKLAPLFSDMNIEIFETTLSNKKVAGKVEIEKSSDIFKKFINDQKELKFLITFKDSFGSDKVQWWKIKFNNSSPIFINNNGPYEIDLIPF